MSPSLQPSERRVVDAIAADLATAVECTAQELADRIGVGRTSVIRTAQALGYDGYPQMRVALARDLAFAAPRDRDDGTALGSLRSAVDDFGRHLAQITAALSDEGVEGFVAALDQAARVVVVASGLSTPLGLDAAMRLNSVGRPSEYLPDTLAQQIAAGTLQAGSVCLVLSGSGANEASLEAATVARTAGATVLALTSFARAPLVSRADIALVIPQAIESFPEELVHASRAGMALILEALVDLLVDRRGERGQAARTAALSVVGKRLSE